MQLYCSGLMFQNLLSNYLLISIEQVRIDPVIIQDAFTKNLTILFLQSLEKKQHLLLLEIENSRSVQESVKMKDAVIYEQINMT